MGKEEDTARGRSLELQVEATLRVFGLYFRSIAFEGVKSDKIKYVSLLWARLFLDSFAYKEKGDSRAPP